MAVFVTNVVCIYQPELMWHQVCFACSLDSYSIRMFCMQPDVCPSLLLLTTRVSVFALFVMRRCYINYNTHTLTHTPLYELSNRCYAAVTITRLFHPDSLICSHLQHVLHTVHGRPGAVFSEGFHVAARGGRQVREFHHVVQ